MMRIFDEVVEDIAQMVRLLERRGPVDRRRLAFRVTEDEYRQLQFQASSYRLYREPNPLPIADPLHILGVKIVPDLPHD